MIKYLIVNADDFAMTNGISDAIISSFRNGIVTSTTLYATCGEEELSYAKSLLKHNKGLGVGAHLVLSKSKPLIKSHKSLLDEKGNFRFRSSFDLDEKVNGEEVYKEWKAQLQRLLRHFKLTHFDSHHHMHLEPQLFPIAMKLSEEFKLPLRSKKTKLPMEVACNTTFYNEKATLEQLGKIFKDHDGLLELMVHPGVLNDKKLQAISSYTDVRQVESNILTSSELKKIIDEHKIVLLNYEEISGLSD